MTNRVLTSGCLAAVVGAVAIAAVPVAGQTPAPKPAAPAVAVRPGVPKPAEGAKATKTPWGEPDLQGVWTSDAALGIPRERPEKFGDRAVLTDEEFAEAAKADAQRRDAGVNAVGAFRNDGAWKTRSYRQTSIVVEPEDGHTPAFTEQALTRTAPRDRGSFGEGPFNDQLDFTLYDRCMTRGIVGSIMPVVYGNGNRIIQAPGMVDHQLRDGARHARHLHGRPAASALEDPAVSGRFARPLGRHHARHRDDEFHRPDQHRRRQRQRPAPQRRPQADRADLPRGHRRTAVRSAHRRSEDLRRSRGRSRCRSRRLPATCCCRTSATKATTCSRTRSAPSAPKTRRSRRMPGRASSGGARACSRTWMQERGRSPGGQTRTIRSNTRTDGTTITPDDYEAPARAGADHEAERQGGTPRRTSAARPRRTGRRPTASIRTSPTSGPDRSRSPTGRSTSTNRRSSSGSPSHRAADSRYLFASRICVTKTSM